MKAYWSLIKVDLKLAYRQSVVIFFTFIFPMIFFFGFAELLRADQGGTIPFVVSMVLVLGILGNGLFGAGMRTVQDREQNILRRFKVAPITPTPVLAASVITGWLIYLPAVLLVVALAHWFYGMAFPERWLSFLVLVSLGVMAFRAIGLIVASVVNSVQESNIIIQLLYLGMLLLSGATFPITMLPKAAQAASQFLPASYLVTGFQGIFLRGESLRENWTSALALTLTLALGIFLSSQLFRWEKDEKIRPAAKAWLLAVMAPFLLLGGYDLFRGGQIQKAEILWREIQRSENLLIRNARIFTGTRLIPSGAVLIREGRIAEVFDEPEPGVKGVQIIEAAGKTVLPGLIDGHARLSGSGALEADAPALAPPVQAKRSAAAQLYCGVTAVRGAGDPLAAALEVKQDLRSGLTLGSSLFLYASPFEAPGGLRSALLKRMPARPDPQSEEAAVELTPEEVRRRIASLEGIDGLYTDLTARSGNVSAELLRAVGEAAAEAGLPWLVTVPDAAQLEVALEAGASGVEACADGDVAEQLWRRMGEQGVSYSPTLAALEARLERARGSADILEHSLVQQVVDRELRQKARTALAGRAEPAARQARALQRFEQAKKNLLAAHQAGVPVAAGSAAGSPLVFPGAALHRELQLWVEAGIPAREAIEAATSQAARMLGGDAGATVGVIEAGRDADLLIIDGNPLEDMQAAEHISTLIYKGERIERRMLLRRR